MAAHYLKSLRDITKPSGHLFLTWFLGHPNNPVESRLGPEENFQDRSGNLLSAIFSLAAVEQLSSSAGLLIERISYGFWRDWPVNVHGLKAQYGQDVVILRRPVELPTEFDANRYLAINNDVADAGVDPVIPRPRLQRRATLSVAVRRFRRQRQQKASPRVPGNWSK